MHQLKLLTGMKTETAVKFINMRYPGKCLPKTTVAQKIQANLLLMIVVGVWRWANGRNI